VIIDDFHIRRTFCATRPLEADSPLLIDPDAELAGAIALQRLEPIAPQEPQIVHGRCVENFKPSVNLPGEALKFPNERARRESRRSRYSHFRNLGVFTP
jgi:hypothetical protein